MLVPGENGQVRLSGWGGPPRQVQQRNFPGCRHGGPGWTLMAHEADVAKRSGGPVGTPIAAPAAFGPVPSLRPPVLPAALAVSSCLIYFLLAWGGVSIISPVMASPPTPVSEHEVSCFPCQGAQSCRCTLHASVHSGASRAPADSFSLEDVRWPRVQLAA